MVSGKYCEYRPSSPTQTRKRKKTTTTTSTCTSRKCVQPAGLLFKKILPPIMFFRKNIIKLLKWKQLKFNHLENFKAFGNRKCVPNFIGHTLAALHHFLYPMASFYIPGSKREGRVIKNTEGRRKISDRFSSTLMERRNVFGRVLMNFIFPFYGFIHRLDLDVRYEAIRLFSLLLIWAGERSCAIAWNRILISFLFSFSFQKENSNINKKWKKIFKE